MGTAQSQANPPHFVNQGPQPQPFPTGSWTRTVRVLAQHGVTPGRLQLVVEVPGQVLHPHRGVLGEHILALVQLLLQISQVQLEVTDRQTQPRMNRTGQKAREGES